MTAHLRPREKHAPPLVALGTMNFGKRTPEPEARRIIERALERGVRVFDTANAYNDGESERILGRALRGRREDVVIATKVGFARVAGKPEGLRRERILAALDESLERLGTDRVELYYLHVPDHDTPIAESVDAMGALVAAGRVGAFAVSNYASWQIVEIFRRCDERGIPRPTVAQQLYNLLIRQLDIEYIRFARAYGVHTTVYNPLAGGLLTGRYPAGAIAPKGSRFDQNRMYVGRYFSERMMALAASYEAVAREEGMTLVELAYAWLAGTEGVDSILVGPGTVEHLDQALDALTRTVSRDARERIDRVHVEHLGTETKYAR